ncbi:MAG: hypothetical protein KKH41_05950 [Candidatus Thermoplasmatota archaeon]|nr:hypothetical protein [Euryarchaeota archaeon]MBU4032557.1 hypothetical protein [Candidatus Thermoplasmatota archaeon]MBU4072030.1 hypothetical protein [Candidatus Thermoplasmatota archaeon]MBU4144561.1 hypothetical protein [Candidatus Thermoplasmatota archaeon]MBU4592110.1 hypothetical protein [Candidatus Thermoplasmatota archaeon]
MEKMDKYRVFAGIILFGSLWGMLECMLGEVSMGGVPMGAFLGGFVGLGLMVLTRRLYNIRWMQLGMAIVAGMLRFWAPVGTCVICSALAIMAEGLIFEIIFNRPMFDLNRSSFMKSGKTLALVGIIAGFTIYVTGYMFTQIFTPILTTGTFSISNFVNALPIIFGTGFFAAVFGGISLPLAVLAKQLYFNVSTVKREHYYAAAAGITTFCWALVFVFFQF